MLAQPPMRFIWVMLFKQSLISGFIMDKTFHGNVESITFPELPELILYPALCK